MSMTCAMQAAVLSTNVQTPGARTVVAHFPPAMHVVLI
jgi:hypothetical protein